MRSLRFDGESDGAFHRWSECSARIPRVLVEAYLQNTAAQAMIADPALPYTEETLRRLPIARVEYEQAFAIGGIGIEMGAISWSLRMLEHGKRTLPGNLVQRFSRQVRFSAFAFTKFDQGVPVAISIA